MEKYKEQNGCHNCENVFEKKEYEEGSELFCTCDAPKRPKCGSVFMGEIHGVNKQGRHNSDIFDKDCDKWDEWCEGRKVKSHGICKKWKVKK